MKKLLTVIALSLLFPLLSSAQDQKLMEIVDRLGTDRIQAVVECSIVTQNGRFRIKAELLVQGDCYFAKSSGYSIHCNGSTRWTVDEAHKEVYVERAYGLKELSDFESVVEDIKIRKVEYLPLSDDMSPFSFNTENLGKSWIVTDLRQE